MKNLKKTVFLIFILIVSLLNAQTRLLVDCIHGVNYYSQFEFYDPQLIDFSAIFPDCQISYLNRNNLPITNVLYIQTVSGQQTLSLNYNLPDSLVTLYVDAKYLPVDSLNMITGTIYDTQGNVVSHVNQGIAHADSAFGNNWQVNLNLNPALTAEIKIGYGPALFKSEQYPHNPIDLSRYDVVLRMYDNTYYALLGNADNYSDLDKLALGEAFNDGMRFLNMINAHETMVDKPFVDFYSNKDLTIDYSLDFQGTPTYCDPKPIFKDNSVSWTKQSITKNKENEIVYEGSLKQPLNFLYFTIQGDQLNIQNQINDDLYSLNLLRYQNGHYEYGYIDVINKKSKLFFSDWTTTNPKDLIKNWKNEWIQDAIKTGLYQPEAEKLISNYTWIEGLMHRAYLNPGQIFATYRISENTYNQLIPYECNPTPESVNRQLWVMLSYITNTPPREPFLLNPATIPSKTKEDFIMHEYGVVDEYYQADTRDNSFFGVSPHHWYQNSSLAILPYNNIISQYVFNGISDLQLGSDFTCFASANPINQGIFYAQGYEQDYPFALAQTVGDNGGFIIMGTSSFVINQGDNHAFLRNCIDALKNCSFFPSSGNNPEIVKPERLRINSIPNPFNSRTTINYYLPDSNPAQIEIYNIKGQLVYCSGQLNAKRGDNTITWSAKDKNNKTLSSGIYFCKLKTAKETIIHKMMLLK